jgi:hypothetical protein
LTQQTPSQQRLLPYFKGCCSVNCAVSVTTEVRRRLWLLRRRKMALAVTAQPMHYSALLVTNDTSSVPLYCTTLLYHYATVPLRSSIVTVSLPLDGQQGNNSTGTSLDRFRWTERATVQTTQSNCSSAFLQHICLLSCDMNIRLTIIHLTAEVEVPPTPRKFGGSVKRCRKWLENKFQQVWLYRLPLHARGSALLITPK